MTSYTDLNLAISSNISVDAYILVPKTITYTVTRDVPIMNVITADDLPGLEVIRD